MAIDETRLAAARAHDRSCTLCAHRCAVDRTVARGRCHAGVEARVFRHRVEYGEEPELVPSHLFYLSGCDLRCAFCIAGLDAFDPSRGRPLTPEFFRAAVAWGRRQGARNVQWVGGEPTIHLPRILEAMAECPDLPGIVWKGDFHGSPAAFDLLDGVVSTYVADLKFGNDVCAKRISGVDDYWRVVTTNLLRVARGPSRLIVRHLLLPGHAECCYEPILRWVRDALPASATLSLRDSYLPSHRSMRFAELGRRLEASEGVAARAAAGRVGLRVIA